MTRMPLIDSLLPEFDREMGLTRRALERVPDGQFEWQAPPHQRHARPAGRTPHRNAAMGDDDDDARASSKRRRQRPAGLPTARPRAPRCWRSSTPASRPRAQNLVNKTDAEFAAPWTLKNGGKEVFTRPKVAVMRNFVLNHMIHHRGQLVVYLRMLGVPVPSIYGPSGDEQMSGRRTLARCVEARRVSGLCIVLLKPLRAFVTVNEPSCCADTLIQ